MLEANEIHEPCDLSEQPTYGSDELYDQNGGLNIISNVCLGKGKDVGYKGKETQYDAEEVEDDESD